MLPPSNPSKSDQPQLKIHDTTSFHRVDINIVEDNKDQQNYISKYHIQPAYPNLQQHYTTNEEKFGLELIFLKFKIYDLVIDYNIYYFLYIFLFLLLREILPY